MEFKEKQGNTALHLAALNGKLEAIDRLISLGSDVEATNLGEHTAWRVALDHKQDDAALYIRRSWNAGENTANTNDTDMNRTILLHRDDRDAIISYARSGKEAEIMKILPKRALLDFRDSNGITVLIAAVESNNINLVKLAIRRKAEINAKDKDGNTALHCAAKDPNKINIVKLLLNRKASLSERNNSKETPLHIMCKYNTLPIDDIDITTLRSLDVNVMDGWGCTALHIASTWGHGKLLRCLLQLENASVLVQNNMGQSVLFAACSSNQSKQTIVKDIISNVKEKIQLELLVNLTNVNGASVLMGAASAENNSGICAYLLKTFVHLKDLVDNEGNSALHYAVTSRSVEMVNVLLEAQAMQVENHSGMTPLALCAEHGYDEIVLALLRSPVNDCNILETYDKYDEGCALHVAAMKNHSNICQILLNEAGDLMEYMRDLSDGSHNSALDVAVKHKSSRALRVLLSLGAGNIIESTTNSKKSQLDTIPVMNEDNCRKYINDIYLQSLQSNCFDMGAIDVIKGFVDYGLTLDLVIHETNGFSLLHSMVNKGFSSTYIKLIIESGASVNVKDKVGNTPLHIAARLNNIDALNTLFSLGADIWSLNSEGLTAIGVAGEAGNTDAEEFLETKAMDTKR